MATMLEGPAVPRTSGELLAARETPETIRRQLAALPKPGLDCGNSFEVKIISRRRERLLWELGILEGWVIK